ncbi:MAG TPA: hypothetical protein VNV16_15435, partial [Methylibium sp.]|nr:hypothetical protein [Methylibium sp.]
MNLPTWSLLPIVLALLLLGYGLGRWAASRRGRRPLPGDWPLMGRPVLNTEERRALRMLREALPQH